MPSNSSIPPSSVAADQSSQDADEDYKSMWADISQHTLGKYETEAGGCEGINTEEADDPETEYSGFYHPFNS